MSDVDDDFMCEDEEDYGLVRTNFVQMFSSQKKCTLFF